MNNPCGLDGFAFLEFSGPDKDLFEEYFTQMGFYISATHKSLPITKYQQGNIQFIVNSATNCQAEQHAKNHGYGACAMGFKVKNAAQALTQAIKRGAREFKDNIHVEHGLLAIEAIGGSVIYFVDDKSLPFAEEWQSQNDSAKNMGFGLLEIDHLTHNVFRGNMDKWAKFYEEIFNFREIRYFDIKGQQTGLISRAMASPCDKIKIPLNESKDDISQIEEFLNEYNGEGIQHIALSTDNIYQTINKMHQAGIKFLDVPDVYYEMIHDRLPWHQEPLAELQKEKILIDGEKTQDKGLLLQIFTQNLFGPAFIEIIQRKGNDGFGEGNFQALFESIERDQIKRGTLKKDK